MQTHPPARTVTCDLHLHTWYSDGRASPADVLAQARALGLTTIALTDHDNARGTREAVPLAQRMGVDLVPAIEFTCRWDVASGAGWRDNILGGGDIDVLGYCLDLDASALRAAERAMLDDIHARVALCCARLSAAGYPITFEDVVAENPRYGGTLELMHALWHQGQVPSWDIAAQVVTAEWRHVRPCCATIEEVIATIHAAGGVAVLAHPTAITGDAAWLSDDHIGALAAHGLDGIEVYHPRLGVEARRHFLALAGHFDLVVTGGSDEHGWPDGFAQMGTLPVTPTMVEALRARSKV